MSELWFLNNGVVNLKCFSFFRYEDMHIIETDRLRESGTFPLEPSVFEAKIDELCKESRNKLLKDWLLKCADIFLEKRSYWKKFIPKQMGDSVCIIESFFACVNSLMSLQLRRLVTRSLEHFVKLVVYYKVSFFKYNENFLHKNML